MAPDRKLLHTTPDPCCMLDFAPVFFIMNEAEISLITWELKSCPHISSACCVPAGQRYTLPGSIVTSLVVEGQRAGVWERGPSLRWVAGPAKPGADHSAELLAGIPVHRNPALRRSAPRISESLLGVSHYWATHSSSR